MEEKERQELVLEVLNIFDDYAKKNRYISRFELRTFINEIKRRYGLTNSLETLREYISRRECGSYHRFKFSIGFINYEVQGVGEFEHYHNSNILDAFVVIEDNCTDNGGNCENYLAIHELEIERKQ